MKKRGGKTSRSAGRTDFEFCSPIWFILNNSSLKHYEIDAIVVLSVQFEWSYWFESLHFWLPLESKLKMSCQIQKGIISKLKKEPENNTCVFSLTILYKDRTPFILLETPTLNRAFSFCLAFLIRLTNLPPIFFLCENIVGECSGSVLICYFSAFLSIPKELNFAYFSQLWNFEKLEKLKNQFRRRVKVPTLFSIFFSQSPKSLGFKPCNKQFIEKHQAN